MDVWLPTQLLPEMVTVSAKKGSKLDIVADIWHQEKDCKLAVRSEVPRGRMKRIADLFSSCTTAHYEWEITFPPRDVDMSSIRVDLANGHLTIRAWRMQRRSSTV